MAYCWHLNPFELKCKPLDELVELSVQTSHIYQLIKDSRGQ
ncbi:MAG: hypothetical protein SPK83_06530 [Succinivibrio dextrinosolvens]|nr:hypothetical protein [Succinivibrio dextrinosolvens]MDY6420955.1 hypothetical protein [Succinivibrio dextrinosolvens]